MTCFSSMTDFRRYLQISIEELILLHKLYINVALAVILN